MLIRWIFRWDLGGMFEKIGIILFNNLIFETKWNEGSSIPELWIVIIKKWILYSFYLENLKKYLIIFFLHIIMKKS